MQEDGDVRQGGPNARLNDTFCTVDHVFRLCRQSACNWPGTVAMVKASFSGPSIRASNSASPHMVDGAGVVVGKLASLSRLMRLGLRLLQSVVHVHLAVHRRRKDRASHGEGGNDPEPTVRLLDHALSDYDHQKSIS